MFALGGLVAAAVSGNLAGRLGRKKSALLTCIPYILGPLLMGSAKTSFHLKAGRFLAGLGAGSSVVVVPLYINEISPHHLRGRFGFMSQLAINFGILLAQFLGYLLSDYEHWRYILYFGGCVGLFNIVLLIFTPESPKWLVSKGRITHARRVLEYLRGTQSVDDEFEEMLNPNKDTEDEPLIEDLPHAQVSIKSFISSVKYRRQFIAVAGVMAYQQISGVNSIVFYGVEVLSTLLPAIAPALNCIISTINCFVTIGSAGVVDHHGRKVLLLVSTAGMALTALTLGFGITHSLSVLSALAATFFVLSFAIGLGPVPYMLVSELVPHNAANAAQSVGSAINWISQFLVGFLFPMVQHRLGGATYYLFAAIGASGLVFTHFFVPETRGKRTILEIWGENS